MADNDYGIRDSQAAIVAGEYNGRITNGRGQTIFGGSNIMSGARIASGVEHLKPKSKDESSITNTAQFTELFGPGAAEMFANAKLERK